MIDSATVHCGDALAVLAELPDASVDAVITDPPYSSGGQMRSDRAVSTRTKYVRSDAQHQTSDFTGDNRDQRSYQYWCALWLSECLRVTRPGGMLCQFTDWRQLPATTDAVQAGGWVWRGIFPWIKPNARPMPGRFTAHAEYIVWATNGARPVAFDKSMSTHRGYYLESPPSPRTREHITQKPLDLMRELVQIVPPGGTVLDPFAGSGTTGVAAVTEGRKFIGIERLPEFADIAKRRIDSAQPVLL
ncbi:DNA methylase [Mycobacterium phage Nairb]|uniref:DNA methylase n=5 Tax=Bernalvirus bernal13 TaxID=1982102 RepID=A0A2P1JRT2_9CAUD|nr:DNA methyltransferase [Mycobacterium phage Bernal13]AIT13473.1 DNA methylase [Mycobacterium phage RonRayGun]ASJ79146.1 DNA methylase [Mycobacterium phage ZenTime222]AVO21846.1 DNA methylase [Mycobacterium phage Nairb]QBP28905.1 DNA methylase [Mycobacterium phage Ibrahim]QHB47464.1 DNA methylase [Mycobacterium phage Whitty]